MVDFKTIGNLTDLPVESHPHINPLETNMQYALVKNNTLQKYQIVDNTTQEAVLAYRNLKNAEKTLDGLNDGSIKLTASNRLYKTNGQKQRQWQ
jgi:hypothetical protein